MRFWVEGYLVRARDLQSSQHRKNLNQRDSLQLCRNGDLPQQHRQASASRDQTRLWDPAFNGPGKVSYLY